MKQKYRPSVYVPSFKSNEVESIIKDLHTNIPKKGEFALSFEKTYNYEPFAMLMAQKYISTYSGPNFYYYPLKDQSPYSYGGVMQFFESIGIEYGFKVNSREGSKNHIPITVISRESIENRFKKRSTDFMTELISVSERIAEVIARDHKEANKILSFSIREMMRNIFEHSEDEKAIVCAQYWPSKDLVELAVSDYGIGVFASITKNKDLSKIIKTNRKAIEMALLPGISKISSNEFRSKRKNPNDNSGFGLYLASELSVRLGGEFAMHSGDTLLRKTKSGTLVEEDLPASRLKGTTVMIRIKPTYLDKYTETFDELIEEGERYVEYYGKGIPKASTYSKMK